MKNRLFSWDRLLVVLGIVSVITTASAAGAVLYRQIDPKGTPDPIEQLSSTTTSTGAVGGTSDTSTTSQTGEDSWTDDIVNWNSQADVENSQQRSGGTAAESTVDVTSASEDLMVPTTTDTQVTAASSASTGTAFTSAQLALYDGRNGTCYIAYSGQVYDVTSHPSWTDCTHHGVQGGRDITSVFPHPVSRLMGIPVVGTYTSGATGGTTTPPVTDDDDEDDGDEVEYEDEAGDHVEDEDIDEGNDNELEHEDEDDMSGLVTEVSAFRPTLVA